MEPEMEWRCSGFPGVPLENFSSIRTGALFKFHWSSTGELKVHWSSWGCSWTWPSCATARGMSRSPSSWMRVCLEGELDGELLLVADPSQFKYTTWSDKAVVTFEQNCKLQSATLDFCSHKFISVQYQVQFWCDFGLEVHLTAYISLYFLRFHWLKAPVKGMSVSLSNQ